MPDITQMLELLLRLLMPRYKRCLLRHALLLLLPRYAIFSATPPAATPRCLRHTLFSRIRC